MYTFVMIFNFFFPSTTLQQKTEFTDADIDNFQDIGDRYFSSWLDLVGYDGISNYIHMVGAGHIRYYLKKWRNLH